MNLFDFLEVLRAELQRLRRIEAALLDDDLARSIYAPRPFDGRIRDERRDAIMRNEAVVDYRKAILAAGSGGPGTGEKA